MFSQNSNNRLVFGRQLLSELVALRTYAETKSDGRKETHEENVDRVAAMHIKRFPKYEEQIVKYFDLVKRKIVLPSMRTMQFAGYAIERSNARAYNCAFTNITSFKDFADILWASMNGCGVGYSVQRRHIKNLEKINEGISNLTCVIADDKEGWADSIFTLLLNPKVRFDYSLLRDEGAKLSTGGTSSGPKPLRDAHELIRKILRRAVGRQLTSLEVHDIICHQSDAVVVGGVRRAALICLFDNDDRDMLTCKHGSWYIDNAQRARANNSAVVLRDDPRAEEIIRSIMAICYASQCGEPGIYVTNNPDMGVNPCVEIGLLDGQFCNLSEINAAAVRTPTEFLQAIEAATAIGTMQASLTDFHYLQPKWKKNCEREALLGVSITGQAENWDLLRNAEMLREGARWALSTNERWASNLGINPAARIGTTKPSGSASTYLGTTPGIHGAFDKLFVRRMQMERNNPLAEYLIDVFGERDPGAGHPVESHFEKSGLIVVASPQAAPNAIIAGQESALELLDRTLHIRKNWIEPSHRSGDNCHNVSATCLYREHEKEQIVEWMCQNIDAIGGVSFYPYAGSSSHSQLPYESITAEQFDSRSRGFDDIKLDFSSIDFSKHADERQQEPACAGGACVI